MGRTAWVLLGRLHPFVSLPPGGRPATGEHRLEEGAGVTCPPGRARGLKACLDDLLGRAGSDDLAASASPPSGPKSMIQSAVLMTSRLCSAALTPDEALAALKEGNARYLANPELCVADLAESRKAVSPARRRGLR